MHARLHALLPLELAATERLVNLVCVSAILDEEGVAYVPRELLSK